VWLARVDLEDTRKGREKEKSPGSGEAFFEKTAGLTKTERSEFCENQNFEKTTELWSFFVFS
jgi:hypothetical protein